MSLTYLAPKAQDAGSAALQAALSGGTPIEADILLLHAGADIRDLLTPAVADQLRRAHARGAWIGAPGLSAAVALDALGEAVTEGDAAQGSTTRGVTVFDQLRLVTTARPLPGLEGAALDRLMRDFLSSLTSAAQGAGAAEAQLHRERQF